MRIHFLMSVRSSVTRIASMRTATRFRDDAGAALISVMLFMVVLGGLSLVLLGTLLGQIAPSFSAQQNTQTGYAAQAGLQAGAAAMRSSTALPDAEGIVYGDPSRLPCGFEGAVDGTVDSVWYDVAIRYYSADPTNETELWRDANDLDCSETDGVDEAPGYALIVSEAVSPDGANALIGEGSRTISAVYSFRLTNVNIPGGRIFDANGQFCMSAVTATAGSLITYRAAATCSEADPLAQWVYDTDWGIKLASTTVAGQTPLCMTGPIAAAGPDRRMQLQPCRADANPADPGRWNQLWNWHGSGSQSWQGHRENISAGPSGICISSGRANGENLLSPPTFVLAREGCRGDSAPEAKVGAGAASKSTNQIVNYKEFGRCTDITNENIGFSYMIIFPCKQDPRGGVAGILWNHKFFYDEPVLGETQVLDQEVFIRWRDPAQTKYCMQTPVAPAVAPAPGSEVVFVTFALCTNSALQDWDRVQDSGTYATSYVFIDTYGRCLTADPTRGLHFAKYSKISVLPCDGSLAQKWNAPSDTTESTFGGFREFGG